MSSPPGYVLYSRPEKDIPAWAYDEKLWPDIAIWRTIPDAIKDELRAYYANCAQQVKDGIPPNVAYRDREPCFWFDDNTQRCKHYEYRPVICREFEVGSTSCLVYRDSAGLINP
jgi:Fe-S-cluster containining protein